MAKAKHARLYPAPLDEKADDRNDSALTKLERQLHREWVKNHGAPTPRAVRVG